jgi:hypothetical protein
MKFELSLRIVEKLELSNSTKVRPVGVELFCADRQTVGHDEASTRLSPFFELT